METYNVIMMLAVWTLCLWVYFDGYKKIKTYIKKRNQQKENKIKQIIVDYLKELQND